MAMDNYTVFDQEKSYRMEDFEGFRKYRAGTTDVLFTHQFRSVWDWPEHKVFKMASFKERYLDEVMTRLIAYRLGLCEDSVYKNYTPENFLADYTYKHDITVYDNESVYTYIFFFRDKHRDTNEIRVDFMTNTFIGLNEQQQSVMKELIDKISLKDVDLEKIADYVFDHNSNADLRDVKKEILTHGITDNYLGYLYEECLFDIAE